MGRGPHAETIFVCHYLWLDINPRLRPGSVRTAGPFFNYPSRQIQFVETSDLPPADDPDFFPRDFVHRLISYNDVEAEFYVPAEAFPAKAGAALGSSSGVGWASPTEFLLLASGRGTTWLGFFSPARPESWGHSGFPALWVV